MGYPFGRAIAYTFYPVADEAPVDKIPTQTATLYVFTSKPSRAVALAGTGAQQTATATWTANANSCSFTIVAINDPNTGNDVLSVEYWVAVNFILEAAGQTQTVIRSLELEKVRAHDRIVGITEKDLTNIYPSATTYASGAQIVALIAAVKAELQSKLKDQGYQWAQIHRPDRFNTVVTYMALAKIVSGQIQRAGDHFDRLYEEWKDIHKSLIASLVFEYDTYSAGHAEVKTNMGRFARLLG